ncbi:MAG: GNAT family N-acetyltransferase [Planctomycetaceae bacterium]
MNHDTYGYRVVIWNSIDEVDLHGWNSVRNAADLYTDPRLLRAIENSMSHVARFRYALIRDAGDRPVAITPLCVFAAASAALANNPLIVALNGLLDKIAPFLLRYRMLFCGFPFSGAQNHLRIAPGADLPMVLRVLDDQLHKLARDEHAKYIVIKEFDPAMAARLHDLTSLGYKLAPGLNNNILEVPPSNDGDYLMSISKKRRHEIRRYARRMEAQNLRLITTSDTETIERLLTDDVHRLYLNVVERSSTIFEVMPLGFFREIARNLPDHSEFMFCLDEDDRVQSFACSLHFGECYQYLYLGLNYEANARGEIYFNMMFRMVEDAIRRRKRIILVGQNSDECKHQKLETFQVPRSCYIKGVDGVSRWALRIFFHLLFPPRPLVYPRRDKPATVPVDDGQNVTPQRTAVDEEIVEV